tara:strand:+ start:5828 stop:6667 length:840 start_codon:yes stop_codon:yes gene_type:complete
MADPITPFPGLKPQRNDRATFSDREDIFVTWWLDTFMEEINPVVNALNLNDVSDTSTTPITINLTAGKTATVTAGKGFLKGSFLIFADNAAPTTNYMVVQIVSYVTTTLTFDPVTIKGTGTKTDWVISFSAAPNLNPEDHESKATGGNGWGSTNTKIRRFTSSEFEVGTSITYADSATLGATFTANENGIYTMVYSDASTAANHPIGISLNSTQLTTIPTTITVTDLLAYNMVKAASISEQCSATKRLVVGDVIRPHANGTSSTTSDRLVHFHMVKIAV